MKKTLSLLLALLILTSCKQPPIPFKPHVDFYPAAEQVKAGRSPFRFASEPEAVANEQRIGESFANQRDFYRAITAFKRAEILLKGSDANRIIELQYDVLLSYYLAHKYEDAYCYFEKSALAAIAGPSFPAWRDLLIMTYDISAKTCHTAEASCILNKIREMDPALATRLAVYSTVRKGDLAAAAALPGAPGYIKKLLHCYCEESKSVNTARLLNVLLPGAGYFYVGQANTGMTAMLINAVFIAATYQFAKHGLLFPAIISGSLEFGWYIGGIWGAGRAAAEYNERLYERYGTKALDQERIYPILMLDYVF